MRDNAVHDQDTECDQAGADVNQQRFAPPDQVDEVAQRHLKRPRNARPEGEAGEKGGRQIEVFLDKKGADDRSQSRHSGGKIYH